MTDDQLAAAYRLTAPESPHLTEQTWEALIDGTLSAAGRTAAMDHVTRCDACATVYKGLLLFERERGALGPTAVSAPPARASFPYWAASIAALLVVGVTASLVRPRAPREPASQIAAAPAFTSPRVEPIEPLPVRVAQNRAIVLRSAGESSQAFLTAFNQAIEPYRRGRFDEAVDSLAALGTRFPDAPEPALYEGVARLQSDRPGAAEAAIAPLDRAASLAKGSEWQPDAEYYGARARFAAGRDEGRQTLLRLCAVPGPYQSQSCRAAGSPTPSRAR